MTAITDLSALAETILKNEEAASAALDFEAEALRNKINAIDAQCRQAHRPDPAAFDRQRLGADTLWVRHQAMQRAQAQSALATVRARQDIQAQALAEAFGRHAALHDVQKQEAKDARQRSLKSEAETVQALTLLKSALGR
ncbi:MAG: hypothetical protein KDK26_16985 [Roseivivax sp.]|nr:hypothetical protein [Roseivivax sp.]